MISPNKTYSGSVGGLILTVLILIIYSINSQVKLIFFTIYTLITLSIFFIIISASLLSQIEIS